jgi:hypothetical protein
MRAMRTAAFTAMPLEKFSAAVREKLCRAAWRCTHGRRLDWMRTAPSFMCVAHSDVSSPGKLAGLYVRAFRQHEVSTAPPFNVSQTCLIGGADQLICYWLLS